MPFKPGHVRTGGRKKRNLEPLPKPSLEVALVLQECIFSPVEEMVKLYRTAWAVFENYGKIYDAICKGRLEAGLYPTDDKAILYLKLCSEIARDLATYSYSKPKASEIKREDPLAGMTPDQKLQALLSYVKLLEAEIHGPSVTIPPPGSSIENKNQ